MFTISEYLAHGPFGETRGGLDLKRKIPTLSMPVIKDLGGEIPGGHRKTSEPNRGDPRRPEGEGPTRAECRLDLKMRSRAGPS
jgi:hypothetical protein